MTFILTQNDRNSALWARLLNHMVDQRQMLRERNDGPHDSTKTAELRGRIAAYTELVDLDKEAPDFTK